MAVWINRRDRRLFPVPSLGYPVWPGSSLKPLVCVRECVCVCVCVLTAFSIITGTDLIYALREQELLLLPGCLAGRGSYISAYKIWAEQGVCVCVCVCVCNWLRATKQQLLPTLNGALNCISAGNKPEINLKAIKMLLCVAFYYLLNNVCLYYEFNSLIFKQLWSSVELQLVLPTFACCK